MAKLNKVFAKDCDRLLKAGQKKALRTFHEAAAKIPAYKHFLHTNGVNPKKIRNFKDFQYLPIVTKENYLRQYSLNELMWNGNSFVANTISVSSGSTGEPFFWLRDRSQQEEAADIYYDIYKNMFDCDDVPTLLVVCFSMGIWIAGSYTTLGAMACIERGLRMNIITPALEVSDGVAAIKRLHKDYKQIILAGYPPFIKDLLDKGTEEGIKWSSLNVGFTAAGETLGEELREYFLKRGSSYSDPKKVISIYGTVDAGIVAYETPLSIVLRREIYHLDRQEELFGRKVLPTLVQFDPRQKYIEEVEGSIVFTSSTGIPLIRYNIRDNGGVFTRLDQLVEDEPKLSSLVLKNGVDVKKWSRPFVFIHGRANFAATLYAVLIYPENIKKAMFNPKLTSSISGRFVMLTKHKRNLDQYLEIVVELKNGLKVNKQMAKQVQSVIVDTLVSDNAEYRKLRSSIGAKTNPKIVLRLAGDPEYFSRTPNKQRWTQRQVRIK